MKKFKFELESVYEIRSYEQRQAESELAKAIAVEAEIKNNLNLIAAKYLQMKQISSGSKNFEEILSCTQHCKLLDFQKEELLKQLAEANIVTEEKRKILQECMKKTAALEKLKEIQYKEYKAEIERIEKKRLMELASVKKFAESQKK